MTSLPGRSSSTCRAAGGVGRKPMPFAASGLCSIGPWWPPRSRTGPPSGPESSGGSRTAPATDRGRAPALDHPPLGSQRYGCGRRGLVPCALVRSWPFGPEESVVVTSADTQYPGARWCTTHLTRWLWCGCLLIDRCVGGPRKGPPSPPRSSRRGGPAALLDLTRAPGPRKRPPNSPAPPTSLRHPGNVRSRLAVFEGGELLPREHGLRGLREVIDQILKASLGDCGLLQLDENQGLLVEGGRSFRRSAGSSPRPS